MHHLLLAIPTLLALALAGCPTDDDDDAGDDDGVPGVWQSDGSNHTLVYQAPKHYVTELAGWDGALWAGTSDGWKDDEGTSILLRSGDGQTWETICEFPELAAWSIAVSGAHLYVGTWEYQVGGHVYEVHIVEVPARG